MFFCVALVLRIVAINFTFVPVCKLVASVIVIAFDPVPEMVEAMETISPCDAPPPAVRTERV